MAIVTNDMLARANAAMAALLGDHPVVEIVVTDIYGTTLASSRGAEYNATANTITLRFERDCCPIWFEYRDKDGAYVFRFGSYELGISGELKAGSTVSLPMSVTCGGEVTVELDAARMPDVRIVRG